MQIGFVELMVRNFDTLIPDLYALFDNNIENINIDLSHEVPPENEIPRLRMSSIGKPLRQLYYELTNAPKEDLSGKIKFTFKYGHLIEDMFLSLAIKAGHDVTDRQKTVTVDDVNGHIDAIIDGVLVDVKSCSPYAFDKFKDGTLRENDSFGYIGQLTTYWGCLPDVKRAAFIAINKVNGDICVLELKENERKSEADARSRITTIRQTIDRGTEPPKCYEPVPVTKTDKSGNLVLSIQCSYCAFREHCWRDANNGEGLKTYYYSSGPKFFVEIKKTPRVQEFVKDTFETK